MKTTYHSTFSADESRTIVNNIIAKLPRISKRKNAFIIHILALFLLIRGRRNFTNAARYGFHAENVYRRHFGESFDWLTFNKELIKQHTSSARIAVFDPSFIPKSRKQTPHVGMFWSGTSGKALRGLEIGSLGIVDLKKNTALSLESIQTPSTKELEREGKTLTDHYTNLIVDRKDTLEELTNHLAVDGYFGKRKFFDGILDNTNLHVITKLRIDADLRYLYTGEQNALGRRRQFAGKVDWNNLSDEQWETVGYDEHTQLVSATLWSPALKRKLKVVVVQEMKDTVPKRYVVLCSSDTTLKAETILEYYTKRFQIEFLFRDAKQYAGLTHCQARSEQKLNFHFNASLSSVSVAKVAHFFDTEQNTSPTFSLADVGMAYFNEFYVNLFFSRLDLEQSSKKITSVLPQLLSFGLIHGR